MGRQGVVKVDSAGSSIQAWVVVMMADERVGAVRVVSNQDCRSFNWSWSRWRLSCCGQVRMCTRSSLSAWQRGHALSNQYSREPEF